MHSTPEGQQPVTLRGRTFSGPDDAFALLESELAGRGGLPGTPPDSWPGSWIGDLLAKAPAWRGALVSGMLQRWPSADSLGRRVFSVKLSQPPLAGLDVLDGLLALLEQQGRGEPDVLDLWAAARGLAGTYGGADEARLDRAEAQLPTHPVAVYLLATLDWGRAVDRISAELGRCSPTEIEHMGNLPLSRERVHEIVSICSALDPPRKAAFTRPMTSIWHIFGREDRALRERLVAHWPSCVPPADR